MRNYWFPVKVCWFLVVTLYKKILLAFFNIFHNKGNTQDFKQINTWKINVYETIKLFGNNRKSRVGMIENIHKKLLMDTLAHVTLQYIFKHYLFRCNNYKDEKLSHIFIAEILHCTSWGREISWSDSAKCI